jgi:hypothetical protein
MIFFNAFGRYTDICWSREYLLELEDYQTLLDCTLSVNMRYFSVRVCTLSFNKLMYSLCLDGFELKGLQVLKI